ncbi:FixH family protein [Bacillus sp. AK128]
MKTRLLFISTFIFFILTGCNSTENPGVTEETAMPPILEVEIEIDNEMPSIGEAVTISAKVTQGEEVVEDASDVSFEVWKQDSDHEMIVGEHQKSGVYSVSKVFDEEGIYTIVAHVTARDQHTMPRVEITVGNPVELNNNQTSSDHHHTDHQHADGHLTIELKVPDKLVANVPAKIEALAIHDGAPIENSRVRFEIWKEGETKHEFIEAEEVQSGLYRSEFQFTSSGVFSVIIHLQNEELHEHVEQQLNVTNE